MDPEMLGLTYIKGASTDSGIDTNPCMAPGVRVLMQGRVGEQGHPWASGLHEDGAPEEDHGKLYLPQGYASPILASQVREGSIGDLSEISSHSRYGCRQVECFFFKGIFSKAEECCNILSAPIKGIFTPNTSETTTSSASHGHFPPCLGLRSATTLAEIASESFKASFDSRRRRPVLSSLNR